MQFDADFDTVLDMKSSTLNPPFLTIPLNIDKVPPPDYKRVVSSFYWNGLWWCLFSLVVLNLYQHQSKIGSIGEERGKQILLDVLAGISWGGTFTKPMLTWLKPWSNPKNLGRLWSSKKGTYMARRAPRKSCRVYNPFLTSNFNVFQCQKNILWYILFKRIIVQMGKLYCQINAC